jgi:uncharacterized protein (UPF0332 family)
MAIFQTFEKCLESPYLFADPDAPARVPPLIVQATSRLDAARNLWAAKGDPGDVCLLAYESMFAALRAAVYSRGYREAGLRCLLLACERLLVSEGRVGPRMLLRFEQAQGMKLTPAEALEAAAEWLGQAGQVVAGAETARSG